VGAARGELIARLQIAAAAVLFSTGGAAIKATSLTGGQVACFRSGVAFLAVLAMLPAARRRPDAACWGVGGFYAATLILFVLATKWTTAANAIFLQATAPLYVMLLGPLVLGEKVRGRDLVAFVPLAAGLVMVLEGGALQSSAPAPATGNLLGALSGVTWAATLVGLRARGRRAAPRPGGASAVVTGNLLACLGALPWATGAGALRGLDLALILYLGAVQIGVAYACLTAALRKVSALPATLLLFIEPALNPVWAFLVQGERPGAIAVAGGALVLGASCLKTVLDLRAAPASS